MNLFKSLVGKDDSVSELPEVRIDTNYERIKVSSIDDEQKTSLDRFQLLQVNYRSSLTKIDEEFVFRIRGFEKLCRDNFLDLLRKIKLEKNFKIKFIFLDSETSILFKRLITWLEIKNADIECVFTLDEDNISNYLTQSSQVFYVLSINYIRKFQNQFFKEIKDRKCSKISIFIREPGSNLNKMQLKLVDNLSKLTRNEVNFLNIFLPVNESVILLDNSVGSLNNLIAGIRPSVLKKNSIKEIKKSNSYKKYSDYLAYLLFKNNLYPSIRYLHNFNENNRLMAESTLESLKKLYAEVNIKDMNEQNCTILIVDRSLDFITPLLHSKDYYEYVNQELEISLRAEFTTLNDQLEEANLNNVPEKLISISKKISHNQAKLDDRMVGGLPLFDRKAILLGKHINYVNQIREKLKSGYQHLVSIETELLNQLENEGQNEKKSETNISSKKSESKIDGTNKALLGNLINLDGKDFMTYLKKILGEEITLLDWKRILCIYFVLKPQLSKEWTEPIKKFMTKDIQLELEGINSLFKELGKFGQFIINHKGNNIIHHQLEQKNKTKLFTLRNLVSKALANELSEKKYPTVNYLTKSNPNKLLIFISGGVSFNELHLVKTNLDTILISDAILYPRKFLNALKSS